MRLMDAKGGWCILRMAAGRTLAVADSLSAAGIEAWTPKEVQRRRLHRSRKAAEDHTVAMAPTFVFARAHALPDLLRIMSMPVSPHPPFGLFRFAGRIPVVGERDMEFLRSAEKKAERRQKRSHRYIYPRGTHVRIDQEAHPAFGGMIGVVEACQGKEARVTLALFGRTVEFKVATWLLRTDDVTNGEPSGIAA